ncbi:MAG TPA: malonic semialdehyde reductase [Caulobacteraceae bacterium]|jgi:3-hydroxypropanoate dehydrogenase
MPRLTDAALDQLFREARTRNGWDPSPLPDGALEEIYELARLGPTAANSTPARFWFCVSAASKEKLAALASGANREKIKQSPATVIIAYDMDFPKHMGKLFPHVPGIGDGMTDEAANEVMALRNGSLQGAYFMLAARALGFDCGPMSGFNNAKVDAAFFEGTRIKSNFICSIGRGTEHNLFPRLPRHDFDDACKIL